MNLAYPVGDLLLLGLVVTVFGLNGWRPDPVWLLIGGGLALTAVADGYCPLLVRFHLLAPPALETSGWHPA